jgi:hypothetical protein
LNEIISTAIPPERSEDPHSFTTVGEEVMIRTTAVEALARLSAAGNQEALDSLLEHSGHANFSVKRASILAYLDHAGDKSRDQLVARLPRSDHFILDIKRADIREVPQPDPVATLKREEVEDLPRATEAPKPPHHGGG